MHLTDLELIQLYDISGFKLGSSDEEKLNTVKSLRSLSQTRFNSSFSEILSTKSTIPPASQIELHPLLLESVDDDLSVING